MHAYPSRLRSTLVSTPNVTIIIRYFKVRDLPFWRPKLQSFPYNRPSSMTNGQGNNGAKIPPKPEPGKVALTLSHRQLTKFYKWQPIICNKQEMVNDELMKAEKEDTSKGVTPPIQGALLI
jgi:hypothetical protein